MKTFLFVLLLTVPLDAQVATSRGGYVGTTASSGGQVPIAYQQLIASTTPIGLAQGTTQGMAACAFTVEAAPVRFRVDQPPTATVGTLMQIGDTITIGNIVDARNVRFIRSTGVDGIVNANCWSQ
jgi:hypothetical protein